MEKWLLKNGLKPFLPAILSVTPYNSIGLQVI